MALKPTIYKLKIALSDLNRDYYDALSLTLAQHPSESLERMVTRILAYCIDAQDYITFTKGLSAIEEPAVWVKSLDDQLLLWIDVGEPALDRVKKSSRLAQALHIYTFNSKSDVWWTQNSHKLSKLNASIFQFNWQDIQAVAKLIQRTMDWSITITGNALYIATDQGEHELNWTVLQSVNKS
ncbi:MAG: YaeQ family protein [Gammaproteobacteria bacterium]|nr:YaeQ family protein [Gammaproteobacteria bacterium]